MTTMAAIALVLAGCDDSSGTAEPTPSRTSAAPAHMSSCLVDEWRSAELTGKTGDTTSAQLSGGSGVMVTIRPDGLVTADFTGMRPVGFAIRVAEVSVQGQFTYTGQTSGTIRTGQTTTLPSPIAAGGEAGTWEPTTPIDWDDLRLTLDLTQPVRARPMDNAPIGQYGGAIAEQTGGVVDLDPLLDRGVYQCSDTLILTPDHDNDITWTLIRQQD